MWATILTIFRHRQNLLSAGLLALCVALITTLLFDVSTNAAPGINQAISFQGRLQYSTGGVVADGFYNMQFKIYQDGTKTSGGTLEWTETYVNNNNGEGVEVKNGYFSVDLGSKNPFGSQVDWNQDTLWLTMNVAGSADTCTTFDSGTCIADGEMNPRQRFTSTPYSLNSGMLQGLTASSFIQMAQGVQTDTSSISSIFVNKTGSGNLIQMQNNGINQFTVEQGGDIVLGSDSSKYLYVDQSASDTAGQHFSISAGQGGDGTGANGGNLTLQGGSGGGADSSGGAVVIDGGASTGGGSHGQVRIGTGTTGTIIIGSDDGNYTQNINIGTNNSAGSESWVTIGGDSTAAAGATTVQAKDDITLKTNGQDRAIFDNAGNLALITNTTIQADSTSALRIVDSSANQLFNADTTNQQVTVSAADPTTLPILSIEQTGSSDAAFEVKNSSNSYFVGIDASDGNKFKLSTHADVSTAGFTTYSSDYDSLNHNSMNATRIQATETGTVTTLRTHFADVVAGSSQMAIYADNGSGTQPAGAPLASSGSVTPIANSWVDHTISSTSVTAGSYYWLVVNYTDSSTRINKTYAEDGATKAVYKSQTFGTWPTWSGADGSLAPKQGYAFNMDITVPERTDQFAGSGLSVGANGAVGIKSLSDNVHLFQVQSSTNDSLFNVDAVNNNVQIGNSDGSGATTLFTLDNASTAPSTDDSMLGSMYYDAILGKIQCYEADGWGDCGEAPDTFVTLTPEFNGAVMNGSSLGTMSSDLCSDDLDINDATNGPQICDTNETYNFYNWNSAETSVQTKSIYVNYLLPSNFKEFVEGSTTLLGRRDASTANVSYQVYHSDNGSLTACGSAITVTSTDNTWQTGTATGTADPFDCGTTNFEAGNSIVIRINMSAEDDANAYVSNLRFIYSNN